MPSQPFVGIDFGTTNTAVGLAHANGAVELASLAGPQGSRSSTWRTVLFFEDSAPATAGALAVERFLEVEGDGRLVQSIKSYLASAAFKRTFILGRAYTLEDLITQFLRLLRKGVQQDLGTKAVVGRPVRYWGSQSEIDETRALTRMRESLEGAGFSDVVFEYEPVAAALRYASKLQREELILVADFGGGTSDFSLLRVGPQLEPGARDAILATAGLGIGGDSFDARMIDAAIAPELGLGTTYKDEFGRETPVPAALFSKLRRWHYLSFLKEPATLRLLERIEQGTNVPNKIARMLALVRDELGLPLHRAVEQAKVQLSSQAQGQFSLPAIALEVAMERENLETWISPELEAIDDTLERMLRDAGVPAAQVDTVFATGGSSLVPVVRRRLAARFGANKLMGGEELTSVAWGLAARARQIFS